MGAPIVTTGDKIATRKAFGDTLLQLGGKYKNIVVLDADLSSSVQTHMFAKAFSERHFNMGIAEANMICSAAGFSIRGKIPFACSFSMFAVGRAWEQVRNTLGYGNMNVKVVGTHAGILTGEDGATHQALEDIACMRVIPNMKVFCPADAVETAQVIEAVVNDFGPTYIRLGRQGVPVIYDDSYHFQIGKGSIVREGTDVCIYATGTTVSTSLEAARLLEADGLSVMVVNLCSIKPIDEELIVETAKRVKMLVTAEDHNIIGGLGGAVAEVLVSRYPKFLQRIGMRDSFGESGKSQDLYKKYKLDGLGIHEQVKEFWAKMEK